MSTSFVPNSILKDAKLAFEKTVSQVPPSQVMSIAATETSDGPSEVYPQLDESPQLEEITSEMTYQSLGDRSQTIVNVPYGKGLIFKRTDIEDNKTGTIMKRVNNLAVNAASHPELLLAALLVAGETGDCIDGGDFFDATHPDLGPNGVGNQSNLYTGTGTTAAQLNTDFRGAWGVLGAIQAYNGEPFHPLGIVDAIVLCSLARELALREVLESAVLGSNSNIVQGRARVLASARLTGDDWYLATMGTSPRPLIFQERVRLQVEKNTVNEVEWRDKQQASFAVRARYGVGYGEWRSIQKINN